MCNGEFKILKIPLKSLNFNLFKLPAHGTCEHISGEASVQARPAAVVSAGCGHRLVGKVLSSKKVAKNITTNSLGVSHNLAGL